MMISFTVLFKLRDSFSAWEVFHEQSMKVTKSVLKLKNIIKKKIKKKHRLVCCITLYVSFHVLGVTNGSNTFLFRR